MASDFSTPIQLHPETSAPSQRIVVQAIVVLFGLGFVGLLCVEILKELKSPLRKIPGPFYAPWTIAHLQYFFAKGTVPQYVEKQHKRYGKVMRLGPRQLWISDCEAIKRIISTVDLPKVAMYAEISRDRHSPGLFGEIRPEPHKRLKRFLAPAFTTKYVDGLDEIFRFCVKGLLQRYFDMSKQGSQSFRTDLMDDIHNVALDVMGECSFGQGFGQINPTVAPQKGVSDDVWRSIPRSVFDAQATRYQLVYVKRFLRKFGIDLKFDWSPEMIKAIEATVSVRKDGSKTHRQDLLQHVIEEGKRPDNGMKFNTREMVDQMSEILLAGTETTSGTVASLFIRLARNPDQKRRLLESLPVLDHSDDLISGPQVRNDPCFEYLSACVQESLRMDPIASEMGRRTGKDWVNLAGYDLPPHTVVSASYRALHYDPEYWPESERFWPERWLPEGKRNGAPEACLKAYYPFSAGKHNCLGQNFALAEIRTVVANILTRFDIEEVPGQHLELRQYITIQTKDGHWNVILTPRRKITT